MHPGNRLIQFSIHKPKLITAIMVAVTLLLGSLMSMVQVDTDPENMLSRDESVRVFHNLTKKEFTLFDMVVLGIVNEKDQDGVFNPATLQRVQELTEFARTLNWPDPDESAAGRIGVVKQDIIAPGNVDNITQAGPGQVRFEWLMKEAPSTRGESRQIRADAMGNPLLKGTLVSEDGKALALYLPVTSKDLAHKVRMELKEKIATFSGNEEYFITGLPVAEDTFGVEMFIQMAISAPLAMLAIFLLMLFFFRKLTLIVAPMIIAMVSVICTMGLLIGTGNTVHIMSSMIPIFLMPVAVVDSVHILSEFFDEYQKTRNRKTTLEHVMAQLFMPMLYTSLTSAAGFASLALTPIPPVQAFGVFVACGILIAWLLTITFIPAYVMMLKEESLAGLGNTSQSAGSGGTCLTRLLRRLGKMTYTRPKPIIALSMAVLAVSFYGFTKIQVNDNPVKWFTPDHPIRKADRVLNSHFGGTYEAFLVLEAEETHETAADLASLLKIALAKLNSSGTNSTDIVIRALATVDEQAGKTTNSSELITTLEKSWEGFRDRTGNDADYDLWSDILDILDRIRNRGQIFKEPAMLRYIQELQNHLLSTDIVGKSNSVADIVMKVHQELYEGNQEYFRVPDSTAATAQTLISYQNSHKPDDLWHFVTPDYRKANIWVQLKSGDNKDMEKVLLATERFFAENPPPIPLVHKWAGLTYLNVIWQDKMVNGMLKAFMGSFVVVFIMMTFFFRSPLWGIIAMVPLTVTISLIYGIVGLIGKDYDMPIAVLSSLTLGLAVDFAIHFLERSRMAFKTTGNWKDACSAMFEEPARAIFRNVIVVAIGFTPLLAAPLMTYKTVGIFLSSIMVISGLATMFIIPALITVLEKRMFKGATPGE